MKKFLSIIKPAISAAIRPKTTNKKVATKLCRAFLPISPNVLSANLQPTDAPKISRQKSIISAEISYAAISVIYKSPLATKVPDNKAAGNFNLSKK